MSISMEWIRMAMCLPFLATFTQRHDTWAPLQLLKCHENAQSVKCYTHLLLYMFVRSSIRLCLSRLAIAAINFSSSTIATLPPLWNLIFFLYFFFAFAYRVLYCVKFFFFYFYSWFPFSIFFFLFFFHKESLRKYKITAATCIHGNRWMFCGRKILWLSMATCSICTHSAQDGTLIYRCVSFPTRIEWHSLPDTHYIRIRADRTESHQCQPYVGNDPWNGKKKKKKSFTLSRWRISWRKMGKVQTLRSLCLYTCVYCGSYSYFVVGHRERNANGKSFFAIRQHLTPCSMCVCVCRCPLPQHHSASTSLFHSPDAILSARSHIDTGARSHTQEQLCRSVRHVWKAVQPPRHRTKAWRTISIWMERTE